MDFFRQIQLINEAYAIEFNRPEMLPKGRQFTAAELEDSFRAIRESTVQLKEKS